MSYPILLLATLWVVADVRASDNPALPSFSIGGLLFGDLYTVPSHHLDEGDGATGIVLRRGYLTFDADFTEQLSGRLRFELDQSGEFETYEFDLEVKDLSLDWRLGKQQLTVGLTNTLTFDVIENIWGFRHLARTPMDLQGIPSRDTGISVQGPINSTGTLSYRAMLGTRLTAGSESSESTKLMGALTWNPAPGWTLDFYADAEDMPDGDNRSMFQAFAAFQSDSLRWGAQYSNQQEGSDTRIELVSAFLIKELTENTRLVTRIDRLLEPSIRGNDIAYLPMDPSAKATMIFAGVELSLSPHVSIIPNTVITTYDRNDAGIRPTTDFYLRLTLFINFE